MHALAKLYQIIFVYFGKFIQPFLLLALRLFWGWQFFQAGMGKLMDIPQTSEFFMQLGLPNATFFAYLVGIVEAVGGVFLFFGFLSRLAAIPLAVAMFVALGTAHLSASKEILTDPANFINQMPVTYLIVSLVILAFGPGLFSIDALFKKSLLDTSAKSE